MKQHTVFALFILALLVAAFSSCKPKEPEMDTLFLSEAEVNNLVADGKIYTINEFLDKFMTEKGNFKHNDLYRKRATDDIYDSKGNQIFLFSIDTLPQGGDGIYLRGRITTDDYGGNFYKVLCIQQMVNGEQQALRISVDAGSIGGLFPRGQEILIRCNGLSIGRYANQPQLCVPSYNNNVYAVHADEKVGWAPGRIPFARFRKAAYRIGMPDVNQLYYDEITDLTSYTRLLSVDNLVEARKMDAKLVRIKNVHFTGEYADRGSRTMCSLGNPEEDGNCNVFAPTTNNMNYPQGRVIADDMDNPFIVSTSEYAKYAHFYLPCKITEEGNKKTYDYTVYSGDVVGVIGLYKDKAKDIVDNNGLLWSDWAVTLCDLSDLTLTDKDGKSWEPVEYTPSYAK